MSAKYLNELYDLVKTLNDNDKTKLVQHLVNMMNTSANNLTSALSSSCNEMVRENQNERPDCPHCHAKANLGYIVKKGFDKGVQRFYCKDCGKTFVATTKTAFERTRKGADVWKKFIQMTITGSSLHNCAAECGIAYQTAFTWRHKILNAFKINQKATMMSGEIQIDEMFLPISYKGNRVKGAIGTRRILEEGAPNGLPRQSLKRGTDNKSQSAKNKACIFCMVEGGNKSFFAAVPGVGFMNMEMLEHTIGKHVNKETAFLLADQYKTTSNYLSQNNYNFMILSSNTADNPRDHKPEVRDGKHIQHVNAMHMYLHKFLRKYNGVSSKYLENYVSLFVWLKNVKANKMEKKVQKVSTTRAASPDCYIPAKDFKKLPLIPKCA